MAETIIKNFFEMDAFAEKVLASLSLGKQAAILTLSGELGAGKTAFVKALAKALRIRENITSPTFVIEKIYTLENQLFERLIHIDAYRIEDKKELEVLKWKEIIADPKNLIALEWPEHVAALIPKSAREIKFVFVDDTTRSVQF